MFPAPMLLVSLIIASPAFLFIDGPAGYGIVAGATAFILAIVALRIRPNEASFLSATIWPIAIVAIVPALWMLLQILPVKFAGLVNPIWISAGSALGRPLTERISVDPGETLICLFRYISAFAIAFVAASVAVDRHRSERILFVLVAATTMFAATVLSSGLGTFTLVTANTAVELAYDAAIDCAALGVPLAAAAALHTIERRNLQNSHSSIRWIALPVIICLIAFTTCTLAVVLAPNSNALFAASCGVGTLSAVIMIRRFALGPWGYSAILATALIIVIAAITLKPTSKTLGVTLAYAANAPAQMVALTQRMILEGSWVGTGAGTFSAILPIYRDADELAAGSIAPTAVAAIAVEMGRPFLWGGILATIALIVMLVRRSVRRVRDSCYSSAGASCAVTFTLLGFTNSALYCTPVLIIIASTIGIAIAQSKSRSIL